MGSLDAKTSQREKPVHLELDHAGLPGLVRLPGRPDITLMVEGSLTAFDLKVYDPVGSDATKIQERGAYVGFGNTKEDADGRVLGRRGRGRKGDGVFNRRTGVGYVAPVPSDYARALSNGVRCVPMLVETFGGFGEGLVGVLERASEWRQGRLTASEYDETTWAARKFIPFAAHVSRSRCIFRWRRRWRRLWASPSPAIRERERLTGARRGDEV